MNKEIKVVNGELSKLGINVVDLKTTGELEIEEIDTYYANKELSKKRLVKSELLYYLEEMYEMDELTDLEKEIYEKYQYGEQVSKKEWCYVHEKMSKLYDEKF